MLQEVKIFVTNMKTGILYPLPKYSLFFRIKFLVLAHISCKFAYFYKAMEDITVNKGEEFHLDPMKHVLTVIEKKVRNLEKRKVHGLFC